MKVVFVLWVAVCLFGGTMAENSVKVIFTGSKSSSGSAGGLLGCKPLLTSSARGAMVKFQALRTGGVEYSRKLVPSERMTFIDVVATNSSSKNIAECAKAATLKKWDAFSFVDSKCVGYKIGDGICPCTKGDFVLYLAKGAIRKSPSAKALTAAKERAAGAPLPDGYKRKIIYPVVSMTGENFFSSPSSCEEVLADPSGDPLLLLHTANGLCYSADLISVYPCNSCAGTATEVIVKENPFFNSTHLLSKCGGTITPELATMEEDKRLIIYSHEGYGCIPYPDPASDDNCTITVLAPAGTVRLNTAIFPDVNDIDESTGGTCDGDELYLYDGPVDGTSCTKKSSQPIGVGGWGSTSVTIRFHRQPAYNRGSVNKGFVVIVYAYNF